jgi:hypothetical protein
MQVELFEEINGEYFPLLSSSDDIMHPARWKDKKVRLQRTGHQQVVKSLRGKIR